MSSFFKNPLLLETINFAEPVISQAIEPKTNEDKDKLRDALEKLKIQDPSFWFGSITSLPVATVRIFSQVQEYLGPDAGVGTGEILR